MCRTIALIILLFSNSVLAIQLQEQDSWSWASSVQDILSQAGTDQSQADIVSRVSGLTSTRPATIDEVVTLVNTYGLKASRMNRPNSPQDLYNTVVAGWRVIAYVRASKGPHGHFIVLQGIDKNGKVITSDPSTGLTYAQSPQNLYDKWYWSDSVNVER